MKLNMTFTVTVETRRFSKDKENDGGENIDLELTMNTMEASMFLFKICKNVFEYKDYKVFIMIDQTTGEAKSVSFLTEEYQYVVRATTKFYSEVLTGYEKIRLLEKLSAVAEYAEFQSSAPDSEEILDEFDDDVDI